MVTLLRSEDWLDDPKTSLYTLASGTRLLSWLHYSGVGDDLIGYCWEEEYESEAATFEAFALLELAVGARLHVETRVDCDLTLNEADLFLGERRMALLTSALSSQTERTVVLFRGLITGKVWSLEARTLYEASTVLFAHDVRRDVLATVLPLAAVELAECLLGRAVGVTPVCAAQGSESTESLALLLGLIPGWERSSLDELGAVTLALVESVR